MLFTTAIVSVPKKLRWTILANTQFEIPIGVKLKIYTDEKPCMYTLMCDTKCWGLGLVNSRILFGFIGM